jgi:hypothetical protein
MKFPIKKLVMFVLVLSLFNVYQAFAVRPILISGFEQPPNVDGVFTPSEWDTYQLYIPNNTLLNGHTTIETFFYFKNDLNYLYIMVDATGDPTQDDWDECLFYFHSDGVIRDLRVFGSDGKLENENYTLVAGFGPSPNNPDLHRIYEWKISLNYLNAEVGKDIDICSPFFKGGSAPYDESSNRDNVWPEGLDPEDISTWGIVALTEPPVGGELTSNSTYVYIFLVSVLMIIATIQRKIYHPDAFFHK